MTLLVGLPLPLTVWARFISAILQATIGTKYVSNTSGSWEAEIVDSTCCGYFSVSIAVDSLDKVHISCEDYGAGVKHVSNASGSWEAEIVDSATG